MPVTSSRSLSSGAVQIQMPLDDPQLEAKIMDFWYATIRLEQAAQDCVDLFQSISMPDEARDRIHERAAYLHALGVDAEMARQAVEDYVGPRRKFNFVEIPQEGERK